MKSIGFSIMIIMLMSGCESSNKKTIPNLSTASVAGSLPEQVVNIANNHNVSSNRGTGFGIYNETANKTWVTWAGENMNAYVREYNHTSQNWSDSIIVGQIPDTTFFKYNWSQQKRDHHNYPKMTQMSNGKLLVIYSAHNSRLYKSISPAANTVAGWDASHYQEIKHSGKAITATYPLVNKSSNGDIYVFYRNTTGKPVDYRPLEMIKSTDNGLTFSAPVRVIDTYNGLPENMNEVYNGGIRHEPAHGLIPERFLVGWTMAGGGPISKHNVYHKHAYFAYYYPETDTWTNAEGTDLGTTIDDNEIMNCHVYNSGELNTNFKHAVDYHFAASYTDNGEPVLLFSSEDDEGVHFKSAHWTGTQWAVVNITSGLTKGIMDIEKIGADDFIAYKINGSKINAYKTEDAGLNWSFDAAIETKIKNLNKIGLIENYHPDIKFLGLQTDWKERDTSGKYGVYIIKE